MEKKYNTNKNKNIWEINTFLKNDNEIYTGASKQKEMLEEDKKFNLNSV